MRIRRVVGAGVAVGIAASAAVFAALPAQAASTVNAQLSFSGLATSSSPAGGKVVGIHPGDSVTFTAASVPTAGLNQLGVGSLLNGLLGGITSVEYKMHLPANFPGGARDVLVGSGPGAVPSFTASFPAGDYNFTWDAYSVTLLPLLPPSVNLLNLAADGNQLKAVGVALNAKSEWEGEVVASASPPAGGISVQLPTVSAQPSLPVVGTLPPVKVPGVTTPTIPTSGLPGLPGVGGSSGTTNPGSSTSTSPGSVLHYKPTGPTIADKTMPKGYGSGSGIGGSYVQPGLNNAINAPALNFQGSGSSASRTAATNTAATPAAKPGQSSVDLASTNAHSAVTGLPALLVVLAVLALSAATAFYARTFLIHRPAKAAAAK